jgi:hypothetical protein
MSHFLKLKHTSTHCIPIQYGNELLHRSTERMSVANGNVVRNPSYGTKQIGDDATTNGKTSNPHRR